MSLYSRHTYAAETVRIAAVAIVVLAFAASAAAQGNGRVRGRVVDEDGNPMEGVRVTTANPESNPPEFDTETASNGRYSILGLISGQWMFRAECADACAEANGSPYGYRLSEGVWPVLQSGNSPVDFTLRRVRHPLEDLLGDAGGRGRRPQCGHGLGGGGGRGVQQRQPRGRDRRVRGGVGATAAMDTSAGAHWHRLRQDAEL